MAISAIICPSDAIKGGRPLNLKKERKGKKKERKVKERKVKE